MTEKINIYVYKISSTHDPIEALRSQLQLVLDENKIIKEEIKSLREENEKIKQELVNLKENQQRFNNNQNNNNIQYSDKLSNSSSIQKSKYYTFEEEEEEMTSRFNVNMKLSEFNNLSLKDQESVSEILYNTSSNQFFTKISELLLYLIQIIDGNEKNLVEISGPGQTKLTHLQYESTVILHSSAVERLTQNRCFERSEFKDVLEKFYSITAELVCPPDSFKDTYNMIPSSFVSSLKLSVYNFWH